ncbi:unnamed protein product [Bemisia tabaci]|uniref:Tantalus-like domain-containing protein n=1 Tax=Bemisia tabaci TaxID=7038 RepID=A0A9P0AGG7_BEMTA|nr:PREDICTED: uncharacterized protein LOC109032777 [Bemisia tabaci]CAH0394037.1 unnamed protein product [Bemisia tabaci]
MTDQDSTSPSENGVEISTNGAHQPSSSKETTPGTPFAKRTLRPRNIATIQADSDRRKKKNSKLEKRRMTECLETIYEEPVTNKKGELLLTGRKLKRSITFNPGSGEEISKGKIKKRRDRIKKKLGNNFKLKMKKLNQVKSMNMSDVRCRLNLLDIDESL